MNLYVVSFYGFSEKPRCYRILRTFMVFHEILFLRR